jgi:Spy/CpxP family protein refolding chaperone
MERSKMLAVGLLAGALVLGGALGAAGAFWTGGDSCERGRRRGADAYIERLDHELGLSPEQRARVADVLERQRAEVSALWHEVRPRTDEIRANARREVAALLTPEQQARYAAHLERLETEHKGKPKPR